MYLLPLFALLTTGACATGRAAVGPVEPPTHSPQDLTMNTPITHAELSAAVALTGDPELASWVEDEDLYMLRDVPEIALAQGQLARVAVLDASIPLSFLVARLAEGGVVVTTGSPAGVFAVIREQRDVSGELIYRLFREESRRQELLGVPQFHEAEGAWDVILHVRDAVRGVEDWHLQLSSTSCSVERRSS
ncbi:MAG: hypothetical protein JXX28_19025 [Deltaproteobacteria bacterium]|nr:hypothetical protein [Deltaproteobacteria bacterium]